jgi:hypothetical protein
MTEKAFPVKNITLMKSLESINDDLELLLNKNEQVIKNYLAREIYTSNISLETNNMLDEIFINIRKNIISSSNNQ